MKKQPYLVPEAAPEALCPAPKRHYTAPERCYEILTGQGDPYNGEDDILVLCDGVVVWSDNTLLSTITSG